MPISLSPDATKQLLASIKQFSAEHLDEELGDLKASLFLEFCVAEVGAVVYNQAIADYALAVVPIDLPVATLAGALVMKSEG